MGQNGILKYEPLRACAIDFTFRVRARTDARMRAAGCVAINFGIESGDTRVLKSIDKGQRPDQVLAAVAAAREGKERSAEEPVIAIHSDVRDSVDTPKANVEEEDDFELNIELAPATDEQLELPAEKEEEAHLEDKEAAKITQDIEVHYMYL